MLPRGPHGSFKDLGFSKGTGCFLEGLSFFLNGAVGLGVLSKALRLSQCLGGPVVFSR
jgi:hypothetical protein